jgi:hypothetical protein
LKTIPFEARGVAQVIEHLSSKCEALSSNSSTTKKREDYLLKMAIFEITKIITLKLGMVVHTYNPSTQEIEAEEY